MTSRYSFIDIAVLGGVRERFGAGDALVVLDAALAKVVWVNGAGAHLLGHRDIESAVDADLALPATAKRQIAGAPGFDIVGRGSQAMVRLGTAIVPLHVQRIALPGGEQAILLAATPTATGKRDAQDAAAVAIGGFSEPGQFLALVDHEAAVLAAAPGFDSLGISRDSLAELISEVRTERDRLVKRLVRGGDHQYPAGFARLTEDPLRHLLVVVDEPVAPPAEVSPQALAVPSEPAPGPHDVSDRPDGKKPEDRAAAQRAGAAPDLADYRRRSPVRFLWRTDPQGQFSSISDEFLEAVGLSSADIVGKTFAQIATDHGIQSDNQIAELLERRDTWSGRMVSWPLPGNSRLPVDLAALPAYSRDRAFEGFRGFGIARFPDVTEAPPGLAETGYVDDDQPAAGEPPQTAEEMDQADLKRLDENADFEPAASVIGRGDASEDDPFQGEVPALAVTPHREPDATSDEKVIRLAERRQSGAERSLSPTESSAFREIGQRLRESEGADEAPPAFGKRRPMDFEAAEPDNDDAFEARDSRSATGDSSQFHDEIADEAEPDEATVEPTALLPDNDTGDAAIGEEDGKSSLEAVAADADDALDERASDETATPSEREAVAEADQNGDRAILDRLPVPILIHAGDVLHYANAEFLELTGYDSADELAEAGGLAALFSAPYEDEDETAEQRLHLRTRDGDAFPIEALLRSVLWGAGKALMLVIRRTGDEPATDTPQLAELRSRLEEMRAIIDTATDGVVLIDMEGNIRSISRPAEALFGFDDEDLVGKPFTSLFAIESQRSAKDYLNGLSDHGVASVLNDGREVIGRESQGRFIPLFMTIGKLPKNGGFCAVLRDVTQWKRAEEELSQSRSLAEKASSQKTDFLAKVSHEIRTPLNAIIGFSELMIDEKFGPVANDRYRDYLRDINRSGNHVLDLVNDLLDISKIEAGEQEMAYEAVSLNDALAEAVAIMQPQANRERVIIRSSFATKLPEVVADLRSIRQVALNVLSNAVRFTQAGGQVIISTAYEPNGDIAMRVRDTGIGMSQAEMEQALKPFKQVNTLRRARGDGTGLGLPLTKAMVEANRAKFSLTSSPGEGTLVEVIFPSTRVLAQ